MTTPGDGTHILVLRSVTPATSAFTDPVADYEIIHPASCPEREFWPGGTDFDCVVAYHERELGIGAFLDPALPPGRYEIEPWASKTWTDCGWEYDAGLEIGARCP